MKKKCIFIKLFRLFLILLCWMEENMTVYIYQRRFTVRIWKVAVYYYHLFSSLASNKMLSGRNAYSVAVVMFEPGSNSSQILKHLEN